MSVSGTTEPACSRCLTRLIFLGLFLASLAAQALIYGILNQTRDAIRSDGVGYYMYLPAAFVHRDLTLATMEQQEFPGGILPWTGANRFEGRYVIKYPIGEALLQMPFFLAAWAVASSAGVSSVFSWPYQMGAAISGAFYFALGGCLVCRLLLRQFSLKISILALLLTVFGTNLFHYGSYDAIFSHVYSFFLATALLLLSGRMKEANGLAWLGFGLTCGMVAITRPTNVVLFLFPLLRWFANESFATGIRRLWEKRWHLLSALAAGFLPVALQLFYWKTASGHWFVYAYKDEGFHFLHPAILNVLFSVEKGWFFHIPLALISVFGWIAGRKLLTSYFPAIGCFAALNIWIISSWYDWGYGGAFGPRPLVESSALVALGVAAALTWSQPRPFWNRAIPSLACGLAGYTFLLMIGYWMHTLPISGATLRDIQNSLTLEWLRR